MNTNRPFIFKKETIDLASVRLNSDRLVLEPVSEIYAEEIFKEFSEKVTRFMTPVPGTSVAETRAFLKDVNAGMQAGTDIVFAILMKMNSEFIGCAGLHGRGAVRTPELGIWTKESAWGNGYGREAAKTVKEWAERNIECNYFIYPVDKENTASRKIAEVLGGIIREERVIEKANGDLLDEVIYHISAA